MPGEKFWSSCNRFCHTNLCMLLLLIFGSGLTVAGSGAGAMLILERGQLVTKENQLSVADDLRSQTEIERQNYITLMTKLENIEDDVDTIKSDVAIVKFRQDQADRAPSLGNAGEFFRELAIQ